MTSGNVDCCDLSHTGFFGPPPLLRSIGKVAIVAAGTSDAGAEATSITDVGVAGLWRLMNRLEEIRRHPVIIAVAGMDAALASVLGGLVEGIVIAVLTSVGYGAAEGGRNALNAMLASCAPGIVVCNIDNGYGAACAALRVAFHGSMNMPEQQAPAIISPFKDGPRPFLKSLFEAAVAAADPLVQIGAHLPDRPKGRTVVIGAGKGVAQMARALESLWPAPLEGVVVTRYGYGCETRHVEVIEASHPVPDAAGLAASKRLLDAVKDLTRDDLVIALICGGGSALLPAPPAGLTLEDEIALNEALLASGAPISAMNVVRKHLSTIKGGRLAAATRARVVSLIVSDIPGDNPAHVASGPTVPDRSTRQDALKIVAQYGLSLSQAAMDHLNSAAADAPSPDDPAFARNSHHVIASAGVSLDAAAALARAGGVDAAILSDAIEGEARDAALVHAAIARNVVARDQPFAKPVVILSGGETTVTLRSRGGKGGRNGEFALAAALAINGYDIHVLAADTDGVDGSENNAGAFCDGTSVKRMRAAGLDPRQVLDANDSYTAFRLICDLFETGPTGTNVNDFRAMLIL